MIYTELKLEITDNNQISLITLISSVYMELKNDFII